MCSCRAKQSGHSLAWAHSPQFSSNGAVSRCRVILREYVLIRDHFVEGNCDINREQVLHRANNGIQDQGGIDRAKINRTKLEFRTRSNLIWTNLFGRAQPFGENKPVPSEESQLIIVITVVPKGRMHSGKNIVGGSIVLRMSQALLCRSRGFYLPLSLLDLGPPQAANYLPTRTLSCSTGENIALYLTPN